MGKAQASMELISILAVAVLTIIVFMTLAVNFISDTNVQKNQETARDSVQKLAQAADSVYAQGEGASAIVDIALPASAVFNPNLTYVGKPENASFAIQSTLINVRVWDSDVYAATRAPVHGTFPSGPGVQPMRVYSAGSYVVISPHIASVDQNAIFVSMAKGETRTEVLRVRSLKSEGEVSAAAGMSWVFPDVTMAVPGGEFYPSAYGTQLEISITASQVAAGLYSSELTVSAQCRGTCGSESFTIPLTVDVH